LIELKWQVKKYGLIVVVILVILAGCVPGVQRLIGIDSDWQEDFEIEDVPW
jgi:hypothetical protein